MLDKPRLRGCFRVETLEDDAESVFFFSERTASQCSDRLERGLMRAIDGEHTVDELVAGILPHLLSERASLEEMMATRIQAYSALARLERQGYLAESGDDCLPSDLRVFCDTLNVSPQEACRRLQTTAVAVRALGSVPAAELTAMLTSLHVCMSDEAALEVILTDDYLHHDLAAANRAALHSSRPWMLVKPVGTVVWIGPIFRPGQTGCWECLAQRLRGNRPLEQLFQHRKQRSPSVLYPLSCLPSTAETALAMAATEVLKWIVCGEHQQLETGIVTYDTLSLEMQQHCLVKRPQCSGCGELDLASSRTPSPITLSRRQKVFTAEGGHRCVVPEETFAAYQHHISPITGVVRDFQNISRRAGGLLTPTYVARYAWSPFTSHRDARDGQRTGVCAGKGMTDMQAKISALGEALERYSGTFQGDEIRQLGSYCQLAERAIHPNACMHFSPAQYRGRQQWNASCSSVVQRVPEPFDEERDIEWTPVWSLTERDVKYLPTAYCYHGYPLPPKADCWADSNGLAAGNTLEEAILQGLMELVERDGVALWWYNRLQRPAVDVESFDEPYFQALGAYYQTLQRDLWVLDVTSDLNIPTFVAISRRTDSPVEDILFGCGAHFDPTVALGRAVSEVNQVLPAVIERHADGTTQYLADDLMVLEWWRTATLENQPYLVPDPSTVAKVKADYPRVSNNDLREDIALGQQIVEQKGMELLVLDCTRPDIGLKTVKTIVPGLRHFWKRLGTGRLYEVPLQLGWLSEPLQEHQLNPLPMWM